MALVKLAQIKEIIDGIVVVENNVDHEVEKAFATDLMSDALALIDDGEETLLLTGLCNIQTLRTAEMMDIYTIVFVRGKFADEEMISLANRLGLNLYTTTLTMYEASGKLYAAGLRA